MSERDGWLGEAVRSWYRHPRLALSLRAAIAASLAWVVALAVPGPAGDYPYYAPLGAVIATSFTLVGSVREGLQSVASIAIGAAIALGMIVLLEPGPFAIGAVVALGVALAGWSWLGEMGSWVPTAALFVLIIGSADPVGYVGAYAGLTLVGVAVGVLVNLVFPQVPLAPAQLALARLRDALAAQLEDVADGLDREQAPTPTEWAERQRSLEPLLREMRSQVQRAQESRRGNVRARRHRHTTEDLDTQSHALERVGNLVEDLTRLVVEEENADNEEMGLGPHLRPPTARVARRLSAVLRSVGLDDADPGVYDDATQEVDELSAEVMRQHSARPDSEFFVASAVVTEIRRILRAMAPVAGPREGRTS